ncbi:MAG: polysaccharide biosynthesis protein [Clostridia bacterium]|nr:polysaccharide biosynthesis protein [Clostridia bacterium]
MKNQKTKKAANLFASGVLALTIANLVVKVIGLGLKIPLKSAITNVGMGYYNVAYNIYVLLFMIATTGIPVAIAMMVSESRAKGNLREPKRIFRVSLATLAVIGFVGMLAMMLLSGVIADGYNSEGLQYSIICIAPTLFFICIACAIRGYFQGHQNMVPTAVSEVIEALGKLVIGLALALVAMRFIPDSNSKKHALAAAMAILGPTVGVAIGMIYLIIKKASFKEELYNAEYERPDSYDMPVRSNKTILKTLLLIAIPITLSSSVMSLTNVIDSWIIANRLDFLGLAETARVEMYGAFTTEVITLFNLPPVLIYPISGSIVPYLSALLVKNEKDKVHGLLNSSLKVASLIALPCALGMSVLSEPVITLIFGDCYVDSPGHLRIQALAVFFMAMLSMSTSFLQAYKLERKPIISMIAGAVVKVTTSWFLIGNENIRMYGAPIGSLLCYITIVIFNFYFVAKHIGFIPSFRRVFLKPLAAAVLCAATALGAYHLLAGFLGVGRIVTILAIVVAAVVYLFAILLFGALNKDDFAIIPKGEKIYSLLKKARLVK